MKTTLLLFVAMLLGISSFAQKSKTIEVTSAGTIASLLTQNELDSVNNLTVTGQINYLDLSYLHKQMDRLDTLNLLHAQVVEYVQQISAWENKVFYANTIHASTFSDNNTLKRVILPDGLLRIEAFAFFNCPQLQSVLLPSTVKQIYSSAFENCVSLLQIDPEIADNIEVLGQKAFHNTAWLNAQEMGAVYIKKILYQWKGEMNSNTELVLMDSIQLIVDSAFQNAQNLISLTIPASTGPIGNGAFANCTNLNSLAFLGTVSMGTGVFAGCNGIENLKVHASITFLKELNQQAVLTNVQKMELSGDVNAVDFRIIRDHMPALTFLNMKELNIQEYYGAEGTVAQIKGYAYQELPDNALYAGWPATDNVVLQEVILPDSLRSIGVNACASLAEITAVQIPSKVSEIKVYAFYNCKKLSTVVFPDELKSIESAAFVTTNLSEFSLPGSLVKLSGTAFNNTPWFNAQPDGLIYLRGDIAYRLKGDVAPGTALEVREGTSMLAGSVFSGFSSANIVAVSLPSTLETMGENAFMMCTGIESLKLPKNLMSIGASCFDGCTALGTINIPASVQLIGEMAFYNCSELDSIFVEAVNPLEVESTTFWNANNSNCVLYVPVGSVSAYASWAALGWNSFANIREMPDWVINSTDEVYVDGNQIVLRNLYNAPVSVYHLNGRCIYDSKGRSSNLSAFPVSQKGIYIVKVNNKSYKVMVK